jgi:cellulose synthase/poly-beta-1,6-N-acetylglucosamine synthase-like glycosyltransferase
MKTILFLTMFAVALAYLLNRLRRPPSSDYRSVDVVVPAFNEEPCLERTLRTLYQNRYVNRIICVNDGSTDGTGEALDRWARANPRLIPVHQENTGKGGALMHGLQHVTTKYVFVTDADTYVPPESHGLGHLIAELDAGADAVGGIPSSNLDGAGLLPHIRASVKLPMIIAQRTFQQIIGGAPFIISGACGMFRTDILREVGFSDRTKVEDLDLTWELVGRGYKVRQVNRCIVFTEECNGLGDEWRRWRRWIAGYGVCMQLHSRLLLTRYGLLTIIPMFLIAALGLGFYGTAWTYAVAQQGPSILPALLFPALWLCISLLIGFVSAVHHRKVSLIWCSPLAVFHVLLAYMLWATHGLPGLVTGREPNRDKPTRYARVVA